MGVTIIKKGKSAIESSTNLWPLVERHWQAMVEGKMSPGNLASWLNGINHPQFKGPDPERADILFLRDVAKLRGM